MLRAWPLAWPSPSGPQGRPRSPGSTARRRRVPRSGMRSTVEAGGADPDNARHSGPGNCDLSPGDGRTRRDADGLVLLVSRDTGSLRWATGCGRWRGRRARQPPRPQGHRPKGASEAAAPQRRTPSSPSADGRSTQPLNSRPQCSRRLTKSGPGCRPWRAEGAPLKSSS